MLHIVYRASDLDKSNVRPIYYSKLLCLKSLLQALKKVKDFTFTLYYDGKAGDDLITGLQKQIPDSTIVRLSLASNSGSFWYAYQESLKLPENEWVYFVEDDYLHLDTAIEKLIGCIHSVRKADYITLFDHPVRYAIDYQFGLDVPHRVNTIFISDSHHWRTQESTCMTFAAQIVTLKEDEHIFQKYVRQTRAPQDRELFKRLQGLPGYEEGSPNRLLVGPIPSLATHCHEPWLAPAVDWQKVANSILKAKP